MKRNEWIWLAWVVVIVIAIVWFLSGCADLRINQYMPGPALNASGDPWLR